jgi:hypothetical protein
MARVDTRAIERELDRIRSLDLEELRGKWRQLYHTNAPKIRLVPAYSNPSSVTVTV